MTGERRWREIMFNTCYSYHVHFKTQSSRRSFDEERNKNERLGILLASFIRMLLVNTNLLYPTCSFGGILFFFSFALVNVPNYPAIFRPRFLTLNIKRCVDVIPRHVFIRSPFYRNYVKYETKEHVLVYRRICVMYFLRRYYIIFYRVH